jgi:hypothetical protein
MTEFVHNRPEVGHAIIALHDPVRGHEAAFDEWYEADHMLAAGTMAPWTIGGMRWVADRELKALRYPAEGPFGPATRGSYMMLFWIQRDRLADQQAWVTEAMVDIAAQDRNFADRDAVTATTYDFVGHRSRDARGVPPVLALAHHFPGAVLVIAERAADTTVAALGDVLLDTLLGPQMAGSPLALVTAFAPRPKEAWWPAAYPQVEGVGDRLFLVCFTDTDPRAGWDSHFAGLGDALAASGAGRVLLAAPFVPASAGTPTDPAALWP